MQINVDYDTFKIYINTSLFSKVLQEHNANKLVLILSFYHNRFIYFLNVFGDGKSWLAISCRKSAWSSILLNAVNVSSIITLTLIDCIHSTRSKQKQFSFLSPDRHSNYSAFFSPATMIPPPSPLAACTLYPHRTFTITGISFLFRIHMQNVSIGAVVKCTHNCTKIATQTNYIHNDMLYRIWKFNS